MSRLAFRQRITVLVLAAALAAPWVSAAAPTARQQPTAPGLWGQIWLVLTSLWGPQVTPDEGCRWDPNGVCVTGTAVTPDAGCRADPNGLCASLRAGCWVDPNGRCAPGTTVT